MTLPEDLYAQTALRHRHLCPRQVLGVRMGLYAAALLGIAVPQSQKRLITFIETDGCFADGVEVATGCSLGHRTLRLMDYGKSAATFVDTHTERALRLYPHPDARTLATHYSSQQDRWHIQREGYQRMPDECLLQYQEVTLELSLKALISHPGVRVRCSGCGEEIMNERETYLNGDAYCAGCTGTGYYHLCPVEVALPH